MGIMLCMSQWFCGDFPIVARYLQTQWYQSIISITSSILTIEWKNEVITLAQYRESIRAQRVGSLRVH